ncbi:MAG: hypothetical protein HZR80_10025 [Candidatus Heimdallarchaeota archaeon]
MLENPRLLNIDSFLSNDGLTRFFKREFKFWKDYDNLIEIIGKDFYYELKKKITNSQILCSSLNEYITILRNILEINYLKEITKNEFRIFKFLRDNGRTEINLDQIIISNRNITKFSDMLLTQDRVAAIGIISNLENKLINFVQLDINFRTLFKKFESFLWTPNDKLVMNILEKNNVEGYNFMILKNAVKHLNYSSCAIIDYNAILYLKKVDLVIAIAPKFKTNNI